MAERIVSAGVFTNEVDQSFLPAAIGQIGAAIVGPTLTGPALVPTKIYSIGQYEQVFGLPSSVDSYVPFTVKEYFRNSNGNPMTVTRILYEDGYSLKNGVLAVIASSGSGAGLVKVVTHVLHPTQPVEYVSATSNVFESSLINDYQSGSFEIKVSGSFNTLSVPGYTAFIAGNGASVSASIDPNSNKYITKIFGTSAKSVDYPVYVKYENSNALSLFNNTGQVTIELAKVTDYQFLQDYNTAATPWITSQKYGSAVKNLFKFHTISHGNGVNYQIKVAIRNIKLDTQVPGSDYGEFAVDIYRVDTTNIINPVYDFKSEPTSPIETYERCNLDPSSVNYIGKVIGTQYQTVTEDGEIVINGNEFPNISKYVRVEVTEAVKNGTEKTAIPFGFRALQSPIVMVSGSVNLAAASYVISQSTAITQYHGFDFSKKNNLNYLAPLPHSDQNTSTAVTASNTDFYLGNVSQSISVGFPTVATAYTGSLESDLTNNSLGNVAASTRRFIVPFQGGFDGTYPNIPKFSGADITATNTFGFNCDLATSTGTKSYKKAFSILSNTDYYDFNLLMTPGIIHSLHSDVTEAAINLVTTRQDAFYVMDSSEYNASITQAVTDVNSLDTNYTATYYPWVQIPGPFNNIFVPPSVVVPGALAFNDRVAAPWYAPAGLNRGGLTSVTNTSKNLSQTNRDTLYEARINPIANFPNDGIVIWGQKTLQARPSALDRVNVRRLLITVKKFIASATRYLVFDQNTAATRNKFTSIVNPYLESVRSQQGLYAFRVVMDDKNNTPDLVDRNILYGQIFLQPTRTAEFIILDFNIQPTGASFNG